MGPRAVHGLPKKRDLRSGAGRNISRIVHVGAINQSGGSSGAEPELSVTKRASLAIYARSRRGGICQEEERRRSGPAAPSASGRP